MDGLAILAEGPRQWLDTDTPWRMLRYFNLYRILLAILFLALAFTGQPPPPFGAYDLHLFTVTAVVYMVVALVLQASLEARMGWVNRQILLQVGVDIVALTLLMYSSGGVSSGFGILLVVSLTGASLAAAGYTVMFLAAVAAMAVLAATILSVRYQYAPTSDLSQAGILGMVFFAAATLGFLLAERARRGEALAAQRALDIAALSQLNESIVQRMRSGVMVVDPAGEVVLMNASAAAMLKVPQPERAVPLEALETVLAGLYREWHTTGVAPKGPIRVARGDGEVMVSFTRLGPQRDAATLVFLEDAGETYQRVQQLKLMSLGRLTASIAHEVRNPLGAISHASQLLGESPALAQEDRRLTEIIDQHCARVNAIIENVMRIGRREAVVSESFELLAWLGQFAAEYASLHDLADGQIGIESTQASVEVRIDKSQLRQVLVNLCDNAVRYSRQDPLVVFRCGRQVQTDRPYLEVVDTGPGMDARTAEQIFEPFFTGSADGTGLGLYIARELCENNQASLALVEHGADGCTFRIVFAHPERRQFTD